MKAVPIRRSIVTIALLVCMSAEVEAIPGFRELTSHGIPNDTYTAGAFGDYNNDGFIDIAVNRRGSPNFVRIYENTPDNPGHFTLAWEFSTNVYPSLNGKSPERQLAWADFDNDGDLDLFSNSSDPTDEGWLFRNMGPANDYTLVVVDADGDYRTNQEIFTSVGNPQGSGWFDANRDGLLDLFQSSGGSQSFIHFNHFNASQPPTSWFTDVGHRDWCTRVYRDEATAPAYISGPSPNGSYSVQADINNDGRQDILYAVDNSGSGDSQSRLMVWLNMTDSGAAASDLEFYEIGQLVLSEPYAPANDRFQWSGVVAWDADNDGDLDVLYANSNGQVWNRFRDQFYENTFGYRAVLFSPSAFDDALRINKQVPFGGTEPRRSGGVAFGDLDNNGWQDLYVVHKDTPDSLYLHRGNSKALDANTYDAWPAAVTGGNANGVTFGDIDNDGDLDLFLCNGGKVYYNITNDNMRNGVLHPAHPNDPNYALPRGQKAEHYLDVMVSGASAEALISTKDGIGSRVYVYYQGASGPDVPSAYDSANLVGVREIDGGSGYGSQATQVQHFGLDEDLYGPDPHLQKYAIKAIFMTGDTLWKFGVVPEYVEARIPYEALDGSTDTTWLAQTIEVSLLEVFIPPITRIDLSAEPADDTIQAGGTVTFSGVVWTEDENHNEYRHPTYGDSIRWSLEGPPGEFELSAYMGDTTIFTGTEAYAQYWVTATIQNPEDSTNVVTERLRVTVMPGPGHHISIEESPAQPTDTAALRNDNGIDQVTIAATDSTVDVYAIERDEYGNWIGPVNAPTWTSRNTGTVSVSSPAPAQGHGRIKRETTKDSWTYAVASKASRLSDSVRVILESALYTELRIAQDRPDQVIDTLRIRTDQTADLLAYGRAPGVDWEPVTVTWDTSGIAVDSMPNSATNSWQVHPTRSGTGRITITKGGVSESIVVVFLPGQPRRLVIYSAPPNADSMPSTWIDMVAGETQGLQARVFDHNGELLTRYLSSPEADSISWSIQPSPTFDASSYLQPAGDAQVVFTPERACSYVITARVEANGNSYSDIVRFSVHAAEPAMLSLEATTDPDPNQPEPLGEIVFQRTDDQRNDIYAVLRDRFGNFHSLSQATRWGTANDSIATATNGSKTFGQGVVARVADSGRTTVTATDTSQQYGHIGLSGSAEVLLLDVTYDSLRIVVDGPSGLVDINTLTIRTDEDTLLQAIGLRSSDQTWVKIGVKWTTSGIAVDPSAPGSAEEWRFSPDAVGHGAISISLPGSDVDDEITVEFLPGLPRDVALYAEVGDPIVNALSPYVDTVITIRAGEEFPLVAKVSDHNGVWLQEYESGAHDAKFAWELVDEGGITVSTGDFTSSGFSNGFLATEAFRTVELVVEFTPQAGAEPYSDTVTVTVAAGLPHHVVIEANSDAERVSPNDDAPLDTLLINERDTTADAYAIIRDQYGNYVANSQVTEWASSDTSVATVTPKILTLGQGRVKRATTSGDIFISASSGEPSLVVVTDSTVVRVVNYFYEELRIVIGDSTVIPDLTMSTNEDTTLKVQGRRSDNGEWEDVSGDWSLLDGLVVSPPPSRGRTWTFSPSEPGSGRIVVSLNNDDTQPDTLAVTFQVGEPVRATFTIITPPDQRRAGEPIQAIVRIYNENGPVPGQWCFDGSGSAIYSDSMGDGGKTSPIIVVDGDDTTLNVGGGTDIMTPQCFEDGVDTITVTLYHAPSPDSLHRLNATLDDIFVSTSPFGLNPGDLAYIDIVDGNGTPVTDTIRLVAPDGATVLVSRGFDQWGNPRGNEPSNWSVSYAASGGLHPITRPDSVWRVYYESNSVVSEEQGWIKAVGPADISVRDSVYVVIAGPPVRFTYAVTQDTNANGYLDGMVLHFSESFALPSDSAALAAVLDSMSFDYYGETFTPVAIVGANGTMDDSVFIVTFEENQNGQPQTGWTPEVSWSGVPGVDDLLRGPSQDGAGPVIWEVIKYVDDDAVPRVEVIMSEKIQDSSGTSLVSVAGDIRADELFNVYYRTPGTDEYILLDSLLIGITLTDVISDSIIVFSMTNGNDLVPGFYMDLRVHVDSSGIEPDTTFRITDRSLGTGGVNEPLPDNRKVIVQERGDVELSMLPVPNPSRPSEEIEPAPDFTAGHSEAAKNAIESRTLRGGIAAKVDLLVPSDGTVRVLRKIYDMVGNLVRTAENQDLILDYCEETGTTPDQLPSIIHVYFYWNGYNDDGLPVAGGAYREVTLFDFTSPDKKDQRVLTTYGFLR